MAFAPNGCRECGSRSCGLVCFARLDLYGAEPHERNMAADASSGRDVALRAAYQSVRGRRFVTEQNFRSFIADWDVYPVRVNGDVVGAVVTKGEQMHACIAEGFGRWLSRKVLRETLYKILKQHGMAVTTV